MDAELSVGWAERDITPERQVRLCGQFHTRISNSIESRLTVTAFADLLLMH